MGDGMGTSLSRPEMAKLISILIAPNSRGSITLTNLFTRNYGKYPYMVRIRDVPRRKKSKNCYIRIITEMCFNCILTATTVTT